MEYSNRALARDLRMLMSMPVTDKSALANWYQEARRVQDALKQPGADDVPHFHLVMHYLIDADIRLKDARHAAAQNEQMGAVLAELEG